MSADDRLAYTIKEFAAAIGVSVPHIYNELAAGRGPIVSKCGNRSLVTAENARAYVSSMPTRKPRIVPLPPPPPCQAVAA